MRSICRATCPPAKRFLSCLDPGQTPWLTIYHLQKRGIRTRPQCHSQRADPGEQQRDPPPARRSRPRTSRLHEHQDHLVKLVQAPATPGPRLPLPPPRSSTTMTANCRCSISRDFVKFGCQDRPDLG